MIFGHKSKYAVKMFHLDLMMAVEDGVEKGTSERHVIVIHPTVAEIIHPESQM